MQPISELLTSVVVRRHKLPLYIVGFLQVFNNGAGLSQRQIAIDNYRRLAQRMDLSTRGAGMVCGSRW